MSRDQATSLESELRDMDAGCWPLRRNPAALCRELLTHANQPVQMKEVLLQVCAKRGAKRICHGWGRSLGGPLDAGESEVLIISPLPLAGRTRVQCCYRGDEALGTQRRKARARALDHVRVDRLVARQSGRTAGVHLSHFLATRVCVNALTKRNALCSRVLRFGKPTESSQESCSLSSTAAFVQLNPTLTSICPSFPSQKEGWGSSPIR